jgi:hypothetical protein
MRRICPHCKEPVKYPTKMFSDLNLDASVFDDVTLYRGRGCDRCKNSGYAGRLAIIEAMTVTDEVRKLIISRSNSRELARWPWPKGCGPCAWWAWIGRATAPPRWNKSSCSPPRTERPTQPSPTE